MSVDLNETQAVLKRDLLGILRKADSKASDVSEREGPSIMGWFKGTSVVGELNFLE